MNQPIRVLLVDDEPLVRSGPGGHSGAHGEVEVVGEASDGTEVRPAVRRLQPDLVMMDVRMPQMDGIEATAQLVALGTARPKILILTTFESDDYVYQALKAGADGFLLKRARPEQLLHAVRAVAAGDSIVFPASFASSSAPTAISPATALLLPGSAAARPRSSATWPAGTTTPKLRRRCSSAPRRSRPTSGRYFPSSGSVTARKPLSRLMNPTSCGQAADFPPLMEALGPAALGSRRRRRICRQR